MSNTDEQQYLNLVADLVATGVPRTAERTNIGTIAKFGATCRYALHNKETGADILPLLTTKYVSFRNVWTELYFFLTAKSHVGWLNEHKCPIWNANSTREYLDSVNLKHYPVGQLGPVYGAQWRHFGGDYTGASPKTGDSIYDKTNPGIDQLKIVIDQLKTNPESRRHLVVAWNPSDIPKMALPPCHVLFQFFAETDSNNQGWLSCQMYQRSADMGLGVPYNIASYSLLTHIVAKLTDMKAKEFIHVMGDYHVYLNHVEQLQEQCKRTPFRFPSISIRPGIKTLDELVLDDIVLNEYTHHPTIKLDMAV